MTRIILRLQAKRNLNTIENYIGRDNPHRALSFVKELRKKCQELDIFPNRGVQLPSLNNNNNIRCLTHGNYLIFYRYLEDQDIVFIIRITEHHQDMSRIKFED